MTPERIEHCTSVTAQLDHPAPHGWKWVTTSAEDACDYCRDGIDVGHDHPECCAAELRRVDDKPKY